MGLYTITISSEDGSGAQTTVCVDVDGDDARIMELTVKAPSGGGLSTRQMPAVDFDLLLRAILPADQRRAAGRDPLPEPAAEAAPAVRRARATPPASKRAPAGEGKRRQRVARTDAAAMSAALGGRAYRRMPDDLAEVYEREQSVTAVAEHYGVPRHTAQGWMNRLRERVRGQ